MKVKIAKVIKPFEVILGNAILSVNPSGNEYVCTETPEWLRLSPVTGIWIQVRIKKGGGILSTPDVVMKIKAPIDCVEVHEEDDDL